MMAVLLADVLKTAQNDDLSVDGGLVLTILVIVAIVLLILFLAKRF